MEQAIASWAEQSVLNLFHVSRGMLTSGFDRTE